MTETFRASWDGPAGSFKLCKEQYDSQEEKCVSVFMCKFSSRTPEPGAMLNEDSLLGGLIFSGKEAACHVLDFPSGISNLHIFELSNILHICCIVGKV